MDTDKVLVNADAASRGAATALADKGGRERNAREKLRENRSAGGLNWFGLAPAAQRGKSARPMETYRSERRNAAREAKKAARRREREGA